MASPYPPVPPPHGPLPPHNNNNTVIAVVLGIVIVLCVMVGFGVFVAAHFIRATHIAESDHAGHDSVVIHSPLGDLKVDDSTDKTKVDIHSPFGDVKVDTTPDPSRIGLDIYPGATLVTDRHDSAFHNDDMDLDGVDARFAHSGSSGAPGAQVRLSHGSSALDIDVAEFRTSASTDQVLSYYQATLEKLGRVERRYKSGGVTSLEVKNGDDNVRVAAVKQGRDGAHFVLVRVQSDNGPR